MFLVGVIMKRNVEQDDSFSLKRTKIRFNHFLTNNNDLSEHNFLKKVDTIHNLNDFYLHASYHDLGTKLGLIVGTKLLDTIKKNGPLYIDYYFQIYHNTHIENYIKDFISKCNISEYTNLLQDKITFENYFEYFNNGFKLSFIQILQSNLINFPDIVNKLNEYK